MFHSFEYFSVENRVKVDGNMQLAQLKSLIGARFEVLILSDKIYQYHFDLGTTF